MAVEVLAAFFLFSPSQLYLIKVTETSGDRRTFTIIAPVHDAMSVIVRKRERRGCRDFAEAALSSTTLSSMTWAIGLGEEGGYRDVEG